MKLRLSFEHGAILDGLPGWRELFAAPVEERMARAVRPGGAAGPRRRGPVRGGRASSAAWPTGSAWSSTRPSPRENRAYEGRPVGEWPPSGAEQPFDALLDDRGRRRAADRVLRPPIPETEADWEARAEVWRDPRAVVGGSDAGAHLDMMCGAIYSTLAARRRRARARAALRGRRRSTCSPTCRPASTGCVDRGRLAEGCVGRPRRLRSRAGGSRARAHARRPARRGQPPLRRGRGHRARARERHRGGHRPTRSPGRSREPSCVRARTR